jgi:hypothetical protein
MCRKAYPLEYSGGEPAPLGGHPDARFPTATTIGGRKWGASPESRY